MENIKTLLDSKQYQELKQHLLSLNIADIAAFFEELEDKQQITILFRLLSKDVAADVFAFLQPEFQEVIVNALKDKEAKILVVGLPKGGSSEAEMERRIKHFISLLDFDGQIYYENEAYSSLEASDLVSDKRDGKLDSVAAMIILERFLKR